MLNAMRAEMSEKLYSVLVLLILCMLQSKSQVYYITPDHDRNNTCIENYTECYTLQQLNETLLSDKQSLTFFFLTGKHTISHTFIAFNITNLLISSLDGQHNVEIRCGMHIYVHFAFLDIGTLNISSMNFTSCILEWKQDLNVHEHHHLLVTNCIFAYTRDKYAINVANINYVSINNCTFYSNYGTLSCTSSYRGKHGMLSVFNSTFMNNIFDSNSIYIERMSLNLSDSLFINNTGSAIYSGSSHVLVNNSIFRHNHAGSAFVFLLSTAQICNCYFKNNSAELSGGAIHSVRTDVHIENTIFEDNHANGDGGTIYLENSNVSISMSNFNNNSAKRSGGALFLSTLEVPVTKFLPVHSQSSISNTNFSFNRAETAGGAICCTDYGTKIAMNHCLSKFNSATNGGFLYLSRCRVFTRTELELTNNTAFSNGGAVYAQESTLEFEGSAISFSYNSAEDKGAALYLTNNSSIIVRDYYFRANITFHHNIVTSAGGKGGAIFVLDSSCEKHTHSVHLDPCFLREDELIPISAKYFVFSENKASQGSVIYGGLLDRCEGPRDFEKLIFLLGIDFFKKISKFEPLPLAISSDPIKICYRYFDNHLESKPECNSRELNTTKMRGQTIKMVLAALDQDGNPVPGIIRASYKELSAQLDKGEVKGGIFGGKYTELAYHVYTAAFKATLVLRPEGLCRDSQLSIITIHISIIPCAKGFEQNDDRCICDKRLTKYFNITTCNIDTLTIKKKGTIWLSYDEDYLKVHRYCPLDYCQVTSDTISLTYPDEQCSYHRGGVLCGECRDNHSIALGSSKCLHCTSSHTYIWLMVVFAVAGVALVVLLLVFNLTISAGTLNGLIFYANVVSLSELTSLNSCFLHPTLAVFTAWINLDFGLETCFYLGMDTYQKTWLQFAFPLYIWLLVVAIIVASHYSSRAMKVFGRNNIAILATLFLLSYSKLLKTIITALTFTEVFVSRADNMSAQLIPHKVWTYDGNIEYLKGKHVVLFAVALLSLVLLFLPYTLLLLFGQCVRSMSVRKRWVLWWIRNAAFISIMDAYHAPYNKRHRYWTGLMLLTRCFLFLTFATNRTDDAVLTNLYIVTLVIMGILAVKTFTTKIYKVVWIGVLELCFLLNLVTLSATLYYLKGKNSSNSNICKTITASISISFILFFCILAYHAYLQIRKMRCYISTWNLFLHMWQSRHIVNPTKEEIISPDNNAPTTTSLELRESLLESRENKP